MGEDAPYELVRGELREVTPTGGSYGWVGQRFGGRLGVFVDQHDLGLTYGAETGFIIEVDPDTVLAPDVAFVRSDRLPPEEVDEKFVPVAPDLVVEVISPSNRPGEVEEKVRLYLEAGVRMLILIYPRRRTLDVYRSEHDRLTLIEGDDFDGQDVVPGFRISVSDLFRSPIRKNLD
jgi:Uma2 family endonuclease